MKISSVGAWVLAWALLGQGCTTYLYKGPTRPESQIAVVTSKDTIVDSVDGLPVRDHASGNHARFEVLPGPHRLTISLNRVTPGFFVTHVESSPEIEVCVQLYPGHAYQTEPVIDRGIFLPAVFDVTSGLPARHCGAQRTAAPRPQTPSTTIPPAEAAATTSLTEAATDAKQTADADVASAELHSERRAPASDSEEPTPATPLSRSAHLQVHVPSDAQLANRRPGTGLSFLFGGAGGGEDFVSASTSGGDEGGSLSSGSGVILGVGAMLTPLWAGDTAGFGLSANASVKYDHLGAMNGSASITRYPIALTGHVLLNVSDGIHYIIVKGGVSRDFGVNYSASGFLQLDADVSGTWGPTGTVGYYKKSNDSFGWDLVAFFALSKHVIGSERINANAFGASIGMHWLL